MQSCSENVTSNHTAETAFRSAAEGLRNLPRISDKTKLFHSLILFALDPSSVYPPRCLQARQRKDFGPSRSGEGVCHGAVFLRSLVPRFPRSDRVTTGSPHCTPFLAGDFCFRRPCWVREGGSWQGAPLRFTSSRSN